MMDGDESPDGDGGGSEGRMAPVRDYGSAEKRLST
jgi:hypothetical protein